MKKMIVPLVLAVLLLHSGCAAGMLPMIEVPSGTQDNPASAAVSTESVAPVTTAVPATTTEAISTATEMPIVETSSAATDPEPTEPVDPWSLMGESMFEQGTYEDENGNDYTYSYGLPCITADTAGAQAINREIDETFGAHIREAKDAMEEGQSLGVISVGYYGQVWEDVLTLVIIEHTDWDFDGYGVYCYEVSTGTRLTTPLLLEKMDVDPDDFLDLCCLQFRQFYKDQYSEIPEDERTQYGYYDGLARVDTHQYVNLDLQAYPDGDGDIVVIAPIVSLAGADYYYHPIYLGLGGVG